MGAEKAGVCEWNESYKQKSRIPANAEFNCLKRDKRSKIEEKANKRSTAYDDHFLNCTVKLVNLLRKLEK